jgi:prevent-host-death family protein
MATVGVFEAKNRLSELLERVLRGEVVTITRRGMPVARLVSADEDAGRERAMQAVAALRAARKGARLNGLKIEELRREGRR